jgi:hypothetical protein
MSLIKKIDVPKYFAARRASRQGGAGRVIQPVATTATAIEPAGTKPNAATFRRDFSLEHSSPSVFAPAEE